MKKVPIIRKGTFKDYWKNGYKGGLYFGVVVFLFSLINNSVLKSFYFGISVLIGVIVIFAGIGFMSEEYFQRKIKIKKLTSGKYDFLYKNNFTLHQDLYYEGIFRDFYFNVFLVEEWIKSGNGKGRGKHIEYIIIESFYLFEQDSFDSEREINMCGGYSIGEINFMNHCANYIPYDFDKPNFKDNFEALISIFRREKLKPLSKLDWETTFKEKIKMVEHNKGE